MIRAGGGAAAFSIIVLVGGGGPRPPPLAPTKNADLGRLKPPLARPRTPTFGVLRGIPLPPMVRRVLISLGGN